MILIGNLLLLVTVYLIMPAAPFDQIFYLRFDYIAKRVNAF